MRGPARHLPAALVGLALGVLAIGPGLMPGYVLSFDMVFVPEPRFNAMTFGLTGTVPRHVPSDAFVTALATVLPSDLVQKLILLSIFVLACTSAAALVPGERRLPGLAAGVLYAWNPFVAERLLLGHWAFLFGYAALPWVVAAAARVTEPRGGRRLILALVPAAIGGFAAVAISALAALPVALLAVRGGGDGGGGGGGGGAVRVVAAVRTLLALIVVSLPWSVPGLLRPGGIPGDTVGVAAFAARADTPFGALGSLLLLGGAWNRETVPAGYGSAIIATAWLLVVCLSVVTYLWQGRTRTMPWRSGLLAAALVGYAAAAAGAVVPGLLEAGIEWWPALAVLRDGQQYVAPLAVVVAVGFGLLLPLVLLPSLAWGLAGRFEAVRYPESWSQARRIIAADPGPGDVLVLPWATYRAYDWNGGRTSLDPMPRFLGRRVVISDSVMIDRMTIPAEDRRARRLDPIVRSGGPLTARLAAAGVRYVVLDAETGGSGPVRSRLAGAERVLDRPETVVYRLPGTVVAHEPGPPRWATILAWFVTIITLIWSGITLATTLFPQLTSHLPAPSSLRRRAP